MIHKLNNRTGRRESGENTASVIYFADVPSAPSKTGIALIVVLGFLSVLTLLIVTFAVTMRTERLAGSGYLEQTQANHLLTTALATAMEEVVEQTAGQTFPDFSTGSFPSNALFSRLGTTLLTDDLDLSIRPNLSMWNTAGTAGAVETLYIPGYNGSSSSSIYADYQTACAAAQWEPVTDVSGANVIGRIAFIAVNCSGLLDINHAGGYQSIAEYTTRINGLTPAEIQLYDDKNNTILSEINGVMNARFSAIEAVGNSVKNHTISAPADELPAGIAITYNRSNFWHRIESFRSIKTVNEVAQKLKGGNAPITTYPKNIAPYSFYPNSLDASNNLLAYDGSRMVNLSQTNQTDMMAALAKSGLANAADIYECFLDYIDADDIPRSMRIPCTEQVPMINEIWVEIDTATITSNGTAETNETETSYTLRLDGTLYVETWYPFEEEYPEDTPEIIVTSGAYDGEAITNETDTFFSTEGYITAIIDIGSTSTVTVTPELIFSGNNDYSDTDLTFRTDIFPFSHKTTSVHLPTENISAGAEITISNITVAIDSITVTTTVDLDEVDTISMPVKRQKTTSKFGAAGRFCIDPRINFNFDNDDEWILHEGTSTNREFLLNTTYNEVNDIPDWGEESGVVNQERLRFYVRNAPMENAAELGFLSIGEPWRTIRLYDDPMDTYPINPVIDYFYVGEQELEAGNRIGLVNINSRNPAVLAAAFINAPITHNPEEAITNRVSSAQAILLGQTLAAIQSQTNTTLSVIGKLFPDTTAWGALSDAEKESIIANSYRLFGWRDNLFTIIVVAQAGKDVNTDGVLDDRDADSLGAIHRALALVWMDPVTRRSAVISYIRTDSEEALRGYNGGWEYLLQNFKP